MDRLWKVRQQFITVVIVHGYSQEVRVLNEVRLGAGGAHVKFIGYIVTLWRSRIGLAALDWFGKIDQKVGQKIW